MQISLNDTVIKLVDFDCSLIFVKVGDEVQTIDGVDHFEKKKLKRYITAKTKTLYRQEAFDILQILKTQSFEVLYDDPESNTEESRVFSLQNNPSLKKAMWKSTDGTQFYEGIQLELQEKGAE